MTLTSLGRNNVPAYMALSTDIVDNKIAGAAAIGKTVYLTDTQEWKLILGDLTLGEYQHGGSAVESFTELNDTPDSYTGQSGKVVKVKTDESGLEFNSDTSGVARSGSTTDAHLAVWNGADADSIKDGGAVPTVPTASSSTPANV